MPARKSAFPLSILGDGDTLPPRDRSGPSGGMQTPVTPVNPTP